MLVWLCYVVCMKRLALATAQLAFSTLSFIINQWFSETSPSETTPTKRFQLFISLTCGRRGQICIIHVVTTIESNSIVRMGTTRWYHCLRLNSKILMVNPIQLRFSSWRYLIWGRSEIDWMLIHQFIFHLFRVLLRKRQIPILVVQSYLC